LPCKAKNRATGFLRLGTPSVLATSVISTLTSTHMKACLRFVTDMCHAKTNKSAALGELMAAQGNIPWRGKGDHVTNPGARRQLYMFVYICGDLMLMTCG
jgi:hypothetical protein